MENKIKSFKTLHEKFHQKEKFIYYQVFNSNNIKLTFRITYN